MIEVTRRVSFRVLFSFVFVLASCCVFTCYATDMRETAAEATTLMNEIISVSSNTRNLQEGTAREYDIGEPEISYSGFRLTLAYTVRDHITEDMIHPLYFRNEKCTLGLDEDTANGITTDIIPDGTPLGSGAGTRTVGHSSLFTLHRSLNW